MKFDKRQLKASYKTSRTVMSAHKVKELRNEIPVLYLPSVCHLQFGMQLDITGNFIHI